ncbi:putative reverse transcriptase domain-containing protein [Tanacetum coccineum]
MAELRETDRRRQAQIVETLRVMRDMRREMGDMQAELYTARAARKLRQPAPDARVKFATCTLLGAALTWWNGQIRTLGPEAYSMTWEVLKKKMTDKYCSQGEIKKLEIKLWNLKVKGNDVQYTLNIPRLSLNSAPMRKDSLTTKGRRDIHPETTMGPPTINHSRGRMSPMLQYGTCEKKSLWGSLPKSTKCLFTTWPRVPSGHKCNKVGHFARDCRSSGNTNVANTQKGNGTNPKGNGCFECGAPGHFKRDYPKLKNKDGGNGSAQG